MSLDRYLDRRTGEHTLGSEELARDIERFTSDDHHFLTVEKLLRDDAG